MRNFRAFKASFLDGVTRTYLSVMPNPVGLSSFFLFSFPHITALLLFIGTVNSINNSPALVMFLLFSQAA